MDRKSKKFITVFVGVLAPAVLGVSLFFLLAVLDERPVSWFLFYALLLPLGFISAGLSYWFWKIRHSFSKKFRLFMILWGGLSVWYWIFAAIYYFWVVSLDPYQVAITGFAFAWEVPVMGAVFIIFSLSRFRKINRALKDKSTVEDAGELYESILRYPRDTAILISVVSFAGYLIGSVQLHIWGSLPTLELVKNSVMGIVVAGFLALFYYIVLDRFLTETLISFEREFKLKNVKIRKLSNEILGKTLLATATGLAFVGLIVFQSWQVLVVERTKEQLRQEVSLMQTEEGFAIEEGFNTSLKRQYGNDSDIMVLGEGDKFRNDNFKPLTQVTVNSLSEGALSDLKEKHKLIVFSTHPTSGEKVVLLADLTPTYKTIGNVAKPSLLALIFVFLLVVAVNALFVFVLTGSIRYILSLINRAEEGDVDELEPLPSVDELSVLSHIFIDYAKRNKRLHEAERDFIALASHQMHTPLVGIEWVVELFYEKGKLGKRERGYLDSIHYSVNQLSSIVINMLNIARIESGRGVELDIQPLNLAALIEKCVGDLMPGAYQRNISLDFETFSKDVRITSDGEVLFQILRELVSNAIHYTPEGGKVEVFLEEDGEDHFIFRVKDNGIGIPKKEQSSIFEKFSRSENAKLLRPNGTGIGLYLANSMAKILGCKIWFESEKGEGTTFYIRIPGKLKKKNS